MADAIIKVYGFAEGPLPTQVTSKFSLLPGEEAFGVVMIIRFYSPLLPLSVLLAPIATNSRQNLLYLMHSNPFHLSVTYLSTHLPILQVMRLEAGGSLDSLLHTATTHLSMADKMHLICLSVAAIAELHYIGVIHADLKPANFLLARGCAPWELRVADFCMAEVNLS